MSTVEEHCAEQDAITAAYEARKKAYRVHCYLTVRVPFEVEAESQTEAIAKAQLLVDDTSHRNSDAEYAEEITGYLVDEVGDEEYERSQTYDADGVLEVPKGAPTPATEGASA